MGTSGAMSKIATSSYQQAQSPFDQALQMQTQAYAQEADLYDRQAQIALEEAGQDAEAKQRDASQVEAQQLLNYQGSGIMAVGGTPLEVANQTRKLADQEVQAILRRGAAQADLFRMKGGNVRSAGRADILGARAKFSAQDAQTQIQSIQSRGPGTLELLGSALATMGGALVSKGFTGGVNPFKKFGAPKAAATPPVPAWQKSGLRGYIPYANFKPPTP